MNPETNPNDRKKGIYFGRPGDTRPTKEEVAEFITEEMGLVQGKDKPRWSEGIGELIDLGMDAWRNGFEAIDPAEHERIEELEEKISEYRMETERLQQERDKRSQTNGSLDAAERVHRLEARILEFLCRDEHRGAKSMNYVDLFDVAEQTGIEYNAVITYAETLSRPEFGGHVRVDAYGEEAKASSPEAFETYCDAVGVVPDHIRAANGGL